MLFLAALVLPQGLAAGSAWAVDWVVNVSDTGYDPMGVNGTVVYKITVGNEDLPTNTSPANTVQLTIPANGTFTGATGTITGCTPTPQIGPGVVTCNVPPLAGLAEAELFASVKATATPSMTIDVAVPTLGIDTDPANNTASETTTITSSADMELSLSAPTTQAAGSVASYTFTAKNLGPDAVTNAKVMVPAPAGLVEVTFPGCTLVGPNYECVIPGPLAANASQSFTLSGAISAASGSTVTLSGSVGGGSPVDPIPGNNLVTASTSVTAGSDVRIAKSRSPTTVRVGDPVTFTLTAGYVGDSPTGLVIEDIIPATYDRNAVTVTPSPGSGWSCSYANPLVRCTLASGSGSGAVSLGSITIQTTAIGAGGVAESRNTATISSTGPFDPNLANNTANDGGTIIEDPTSDLSANKSGPNPPLVIVGQSYNFNISTTNNGNKPFSGTLKMTDNLPAGLQVTSYALNGWSCSPATPVTGAATIECTRVYDVASPLAVGATAPAVTLTALVTSDAAAINNCMTVSSTGAAFPDTNPGNDQACYNVTPSVPGGAADISVIKTRTLASLASGEIQTFQIEIVNAGPVTSTNISVQDTLRSLTNSSGTVSFTTVANAATGLSCSTSPVGGFESQLSCSIASLPICTAGSNCPVITVEARQGGNAGPRSNTATAVSSSVADPNYANNESTVTYDITPQSDVTVFKTADATSPAGQDLIYVITAKTTGDGRSQAENVTIDDTLPNDVIFISATPSTGSCSTTPTANTETAAGNNQVLCNLGTIGNNGQQTVTIRVRPMTATAGTNIQNNVSISTTTPGDDPANNSASRVTGITNPTLDLLVNKTDNPDPTAVGENTVYTITITNAGPSAAENVRMTDTLPATLLKFKSYTPPSGGTCGTVPAVDSTGGTLQCSVPYLAAGQSRTVTVTMEGTAKGVTRNTVTVASDETDRGFDTNPANNTVNQDTTVRTRVDLEVTSKTPSKTPVALRESFTFDIKVRNNTGGTLAEADNTSVTDNLPANMVLTGTPTAVVTVGTTTANACSGAAGATSFTCSFGTMSNGGELIITMPVKIIAVSALPQTFTNTATVSTTSLESNISNNSNSGQVTVEQAASLAGKVFRDFNDNGLQDPPGDTPIGGVVMTLSGTAIDGAAISLTATTAADGSFIFPIVPDGDYTVTRGDVSEAGLRNGKVTPGTAGGLASGVAVSGVRLTNTTAATGYDFALVPTAAMTVGKQLLSPPVNNPDGTFDSTFRVTVSVSSLEDVINITVNDQLAGPAPLFGTFAAVPATPGTYSIAAAPSGTCGGLNAGFDGSAVLALATGFSLPPGGSCYVDFTVRTLATVPLPPFQNGGRYINQANAGGTGSLSGQTPSNISPQVPVSVDIPQLILDKALSANSDPDATGTVTLDDVLTYTLTATNSGSVTLTNVVVTDDKISPNSITCPSVAPGETCVLTGTLKVTLADVQAKKIVNNGTADSDQTGPSTDTVTVPVIPVIDKNTITKVAQVSTAKRGERVPYVITVTDSPLNPARIVDIMPPGFSYIPKSAVANGVQVEPVVDGRRLTFDSLVPDSEGTIKLTLTLVANASVKPGEAVNQAQLVNPNTGEVLATARARVRILEEAVFDCSDIIGKVFDDLNRDGYQDEGEPGLPGVRMATVNGLLVTSDQHGRYNIACADIPDQDRGSNFVLKLDTRTLPAGYHVTSENPRRVRLTPGKIVKLNFGAAGFRQVRLDLNGKVFEDGSAALKPKWSEGLQRLIAALEEEPSSLMVIYRGDNGKLAKARLKAVRKAVEQLWAADPDRYKLDIETRIVSPGAAQ